eukprot:s892_g7.t1
MAAQSSQEMQFENLAERLKRMSIHDNAENDEIPKIMAMTLSELMEEKMDFGRAHLGKTYAEMIPQVKYLQWFSENYKHSRKPCHVKLLRFIQLWVEDKEAKNVTSTPMMPKAKAKSPPSAHHVQIDLESEDEELWDQVPSDNTMELMEMRDRMGQMETILQEVLGHLKRTGQSPSA